MTRRRGDVDESSSEVDRSTVFISDDEVDGERTQADAVVTSNTASRIVVCFIIILYGS